MRDRIVNDGMHCSRTRRMHRSTDVICAVRYTLTFSDIIARSDYGFGDCANMLLQRHPQARWQGSRLDWRLVGFALMVSEVQATREIEDRGGLRHNLVIV